jgi:hypothetical protein
MGSCEKRANILWIVWDVKRVLLHLWRVFSAEDQAVSSKNMGLPLRIGGWVGMMKSPVRSLMTLGT